MQITAHHLFHLLIFLLGSMSFTYTQSYGQTQCDFTPPDSSLKSGGRYYLNNGQEYNPDGNYYEGFRNIPTAAGTIEVKSIDTGISEQYRSSGDWFCVNFYVPASLSEIELCILIEDKERGYYVVTDLDKFPEGYNSFSWNSRRLAHGKGIGLEDLDVLIRKKDLSEGRIYLPGNLAYSINKFRPNSYNFSFVADNKGKCVIYIENDSIGTKCFVKNLRIPFYWNCDKKKSGFFDAILEYDFQNTGSAYLPFKFYHFLP